jgi:hypothetical protein
MNLDYSSRVPPTTGHALPVRATIVHFAVPEAVKRTTVRQVA